MGGKRVAKFRATGLKRTTKRLVLRPMQLRDDRAWFAAQCTMLPTKGSWEEPKLPMAALNITEYSKRLNQWREQIENGVAYPLGIFHKETGCLLGHISLKEILRESPSRAVLDFRIFNTHWKKGFAKEAIAEVQKLAKSLKIQKVEIARESKGKVTL